VLLNDSGRIGVMEELGPLVSWVEGAVVRQDSTTVRLRVSRVVYTAGGSALWSGEEVDLPKSGVLGFRGRQFSKAKSWALAGAVVAVVTFSILSVNLDLFNDGEEPRCTGPTCGDGQAIRW
jgi:hypothetical protein